MKNISFLFLLISKIIKRIFMYIMLPAFKKHGKNVVFFPTNSYFSYKNIILGNDVYIGPGAYFSSISIVNIGNKVMFGPNVTIIGGDNNISNIGKYMFDVDKKLPENDLPIIIEDDVWIGTGAIILKGVIIGTGSVIAAGSIVTKDIEKYSINAGIPAKKIKMRFSEDNLIKHISTINKNY